MGTLQKPQRVTLEVGNSYVRTSWPELPSLAAQEASKDATWFNNLISNYCWRPRVSSLSSRTARLVMIISRDVDRNVTPANNEEEKRLAMLFKSNKTTNLLLKKYSGIKQDIGLRLHLPTGGTIGPQRSWYILQVSFTQGYIHTSRRLIMHKQKDFTKDHITLADKLTITTHTLTNYEIVQQKLLKIMYIWMEYMCIHVQNSVTITKIGRQTPIT